MCFNHAWRLPTVAFAVLMAACLGPERSEPEDGGHARPDSGSAQPGDASIVDAGMTPVDGGARDAGSGGDGDGGPARDGGSPDGGPTDAGQTHDDAGIEVPPGYTLAWSDEFDVAGAPDPRNWTFERGLVRNHEAQWYQADNASVHDGLLVLEARQEQVANPSYQAGSSDWKLSRQYAQYTSASVLTSGLHAWKYGRLEMRARIPTGSGLWPAWWTLGQSGEWPSNGEIDIMEYYRGSLLANVACGTSTRWVAKWDSSTKAVSSLGAGWATRFHVWRMDWDDQTIALSVDGTLLNSVSLGSMLNPDGTSPFRQPHSLILNLAIGGDNGGDPASTPFPARYEIDYVRVFQKK